MPKFFTIASAEFRTKFSGRIINFNKIPSFLTLYSPNMKQTFSKAGIYISCIAAFLFSLALDSNAQLVDLNQCVMFSGNGGTGTTAPGSGGYGVIFGSSSTITGGIIGSYA